MGTATTGPSANAWSLELTTPRLVKHQGKLLAFARQTATPASSLFFQVLDPQASVNASDETAWNGWYRFDFPEAPSATPQNEEEVEEKAGPELRLAGMDLLTVSPVAQAVQPVDAPFQMFSDDRYLYCFRPSAGGTLYLVRLMLSSTKQEQYDREVTLFSLDIAWEVRYQRSGLRDVPASSTDTQSPLDLTGQPFYEPTLELARINGIANGAYCVARVPTADPATIVWYVSVNKAGAVQLFSFLQSDTTLTDFAEGSRTFTPIAPTMTGGGALTVIPNLPPALVFYAENDGVNTSDGDQVEIQSTGRLMLGVPVSGTGLTSAMAIYDFAIGADGGIPNLTPNQQAVLLVDGAITNNVFVPDTASPSFPTAAQAQQTVQIIDRLAVNSMLLGQIQATSSPELWVGEDGLVHLYFGGAPASESAALTSWSGLIPGVPQAMVAQFDPRISRLVIEIPWQESVTSEEPAGSVQFTSRQPGSAMQGTTVAVTDVSFVNQPQPDLCQVSITYPSSTGFPSEVWNGVPRDVALFVPILNGQASDDTADPDVLTGQRPFFDFSGDLSVVRVPLTVTGVPAGVYPPVLTFVSTRVGMPLGSVAVTSAAGVDSFTLVLKPASAAAITLIWPGVPAVADAYDNIFGGVADTRVYSYAPGAGSTPVFGLTTDASQIGTPVLIYPNGTGPDVSGMIIQIAAAGTTLTVTFTVNGTPTVIANLPREVAPFASTLQANSSFQALGLAVSAEGAAGRIVATGGSITALNLGGSACLFDLVLPGPAVTGMTVTAGTYSAGFLGHTFTPASEYDETKCLGFLLTATQPDSGAPAYVMDQGPVGAVVRANRLLLNRGLAGAPQSGAWIRQLPHQACSFSGTNSMTVPVAVGQAVTPQSANLRPQWDWTLEAWIEPAGSNPARLITFHDATTVVPPQAPQLDYRVALEGADVVQFQSYAKKPGQPDSSYFQTGVSSNAGFLLSGEFTWEFWVQPAAIAAPAGSNPTPLGGVIQVNIPGQGSPSFCVGLRSDRYVIVRVSPDGSATVDYTSSIALPDLNGDGIPDWSHVAVVASQISPNGAWTLLLYINGVLDSTFTTVTMQQDNPTAILIIGANTLNDASVFGKVLQLRFWNSARTLNEIRRTAFLALAGNEAGLLGCWPMTVIQTGGPLGSYLLNIAVATADDWDAGEYTFTQPLGLVQDNVFLSLVASVGGLPAMEAQGLLSNERWNHFAMAFQMGGALNLNPAARFNAGQFDWMSCKDSDGLNPSEDFAIDGWLNIPAPTLTEGTICSRWAADTYPANQCFKFSVDGSGNLLFAAVVINDDQGDIKSVSLSSSGVNVADGVTHHVAATFVGTPGNGQSNSNGTYVMNVYVDGVSVGSTNGSVGTTTVQIQTAQNDFFIGRAGGQPKGATPEPVESMYLFRGVLGRLRFWNSAPALASLFPEKYPLQLAFGPPAGLAAQWDFREQEGVIVNDIIGGNDGILTSSSPWSSLRETSTLMFYVNGAQISAVGPYNGTLPAATATQFNIGAPAESGVAGMSGNVAVVSLWEGARTLETVQDQMFIPLVGDEPGLLACWDFSNAGADITGGQNNANPAIDPSRLAASMAPISNEGPYVQNVYGGIVTEYSQCVREFVGVGSYVDVQQSGTQIASAALKREFVLDPNDSFLRGFQIGLLDLVYLGQAQTDPTLIGYIEGAPPVPGENLTRPYFIDPGNPNYMTYMDTATVALEQTSGRRLTYSSRTVSAASVDFTGAIGIFGINSSTRWNIGLINTSAYDLKATVQAVAKAHGKWGTENTQELAAQWTQTQIDRMGLNGDWEPFEANPQDYSNPSLGRRFLADNSGYALVESLTADVYATIFHATGAALGNIVLPNLSIPPDRNLLIFPLNGQYSKAGSLDGKIGLMNDADYPGADVKPGSYFKPVEAYALAARIERQNQQMQAYSSQFDWEHKGKSGDDNLNEARGELPVDFESEPSDEGQLAVPRVGIANRYVWTSNGGLHAEQESYASVATRSYSGFREHGGGGGVQSEGEFFFYLGFAWSLDLTAQYAVDVYVGLSDQTSQSVALNVMVNGDAYLRTWSPNAPAEYTTGLGAYLPGQTPGKVDSYRFFTFYLPPSLENSLHLNNIVDPVWKALSNDPTARAMRELNAQNPVWRILHRVTYVERIPPAVSSRPVFTKATDTAPPVNLEGNAELIRLIAAQITTAPPITQLTIGNACSVVLNPAPTAPGVYPASILESTVPWWRTFLDSARPTANGPAPSQAAATMLNTLMLTVIRYMTAGYTTGLIPEFLGSQQQLPAVRAFVAAANSRQC